ncbi:MAG: hypothetical protein ACRYG2_28385 [Janthinobacterium lividum]
MDHARQRDDLIDVATVHQDDTSGEVDVRRSLHRPKSREKTGLRDVHPSQNDLGAERHATAVHRDLDWLTAVESSVSAPSPAFFSDSPQAVRSTAMDLSAC